MTVYRDASRTPDREAALRDLIADLLALRLGALSPYGDAGNRVIHDAYRAIGAARAREWGLLDLAESKP